MKDREIAEIRKTLGQPTPNAQQQAPQQSPAPMPAALPVDGLLTPEEEKQFISMADTDFAGAMRFRDKLMSQRTVNNALAAIRAEQQQQQEQHQAAQQYENQFMRIAQVVGLTPEEQSRAITAVQDAFRANQPITPHEAVMIGRFGSLEASLQFAAQGLRQAVPAGTPAPTPGQPTPPSIPGGSRGTVPQTQASGQQAGAGSFRRLFQ
jgi:hypothetical protein